MKRLSTSSVVLALCMVVSSGRLWGQSTGGDGPEGSSAGNAAIQAASEPAADASAASKPRTRAPRFYGQLDLSADQRSAIDAIQQKYQSKIADIERQLDQLREDRDKELRDTLESSQQQKLAELIHKDRERRSQQTAARRAGASRTPAASVPPATAVRPASATVTGP